MLACSSTNTASTRFDPPRFGCCGSQRRSCKVTRLTTKRRFSIDRTYLLVCTVTADSPGESTSRRRTKQLFLILTNSSVTRTVTYDRYYRCNRICCVGTFGPLWPLCIKEKLQSGTRQGLKLGANVRPSILFPYCEKRMWYLLINEAIRCLARKLYARESRNSANPFIVELGGISSV